MFKMMYDVFPFKPMALLIWWSRALLKNVNIEVNIKTCDVICSVSRDFNPNDHNIIIIFSQGRKLR